MAAVSVFGFFALFWLAIMVGLIILSGFGLYRMAQHAGVPSPWMAFVPVASSYLTGLLAERAYYTYNRQPRSLAKWLVILNLIPLVGAPVFGLAFLTGFGGVGASWTPILPLLLLVALPGLLATALLIYCQYYIFRDYTPDNAVLYTILGLLFGISFVFFLVEMNTVPVSVTGFGAYPYGRPKYDRWHRWNQTPPQQYGPGNWPPQGGGPGTTGPQDYYRS